MSEVRFELNNNKTVPNEKKTQRCDKENRRKTN